MVKRNTLFTICIVLFVLKQYIFTLNQALIGLPTYRLLLIKKIYNKNSDLDWYVIKIKKR